MAKQITNVIVKDYASWLVGFNSAADMRTQAGVTNPRIYQNVSNPNDVVVVLDVADAAKAKALMSSDDIKAAMAKAGVVSHVSTNVVE